MDSHVVELINLELDGRLDDAGRAELEAALANDPAARTRREQLRAVARALADAPAPTLPLDFRDGVLRNLPQRRPASRTRQWQVGLALAASVLVAVGVLNVALQELGGPPEQVSGTMAPATATVAVVRQPGALTLEFLLPLESAELVIEVPGTGPVSASVTGAAEPAIEGRRIVIASTGGEVLVLVVGNVNEFKANLVRGGVVTPVTVRTQ